MAEENRFKDTMDSLFKGMNGVVSSKTVVGDAIHIGDTIILPLVDVSFAVGAGAFNADKKGSRRTWRKDDPVCRACHSERNDPSCQYQEPGYDDQDSRYGSGCHRQTESTENGQNDRRGCGGYPGRS